jgi:ABC-type uncharacterized transport system auxiliary subunit
MRQLVLALAAALCAGCTALSPGTREPDRYFILDAPPGARAALPVSATPTSASSFYDSQSIVYSRAPGTRAYYQFNHWTDRPQRAVHAQLAARLDPRRDRWVLNTHLDEIYHDAAEQPGTARLALTAELVDAKSGQVIARRRFEQSAPAASYDAPGAVQGFRQALGALLDELVAWVQAEVAR